jgi:1-acyl-sn-glycerol-3-phosphate acyltransferase
LLVTSDPDAAYRLVRQCARRVLSFAGCRVRVANAGVVPQGQVMFVANHVSLADAAVLLGALPFEFRFVANHVFAAYPILGAAIRAASAHIVDRDSWRSRADCGQTMTDELSGGRSLLVFAEGGTADDGRLRPFKSGAFRAAARSGQPVVPIVIRGTRELFPPDSFRLSNVPIEVEVLTPLAARAASRDAIAELRDRTAAAIRDRLGRG